MSFAGHAFDMINRMKQNRAQRPSNRVKFKENNREAIYSESDKNQIRPNFKAIPEKELTKIKKEIQERAKAEQKREKIFYGIFFACGIIALILFLLLLT